MRGVGLSILPEFYEYGQRAERMERLPLLVTVCTLKPVALKDPIALDSLLAKGLYYELLQGRPISTLTVPYWIPLPLVAERYIDNLPLWKATDFFPVESRAFASNVHRRTGDNPYSLPAQMATLAGEKKNIRRQPRSDAGQYMDFRVPEKRIVAQRWEAGCVGNPTEVRRLLSYLGALGGRSGKGSGRVLDWHVQPLEREFGLRDGEGRALRPIPTLEGGALQGWTPPYWRRDLWRMCESSLARQSIC